MNRGIAGDDTAGVLKRLPEVLGRNPRVLCLQQVEQDRAPTVRLAAAAMVRARGFISHNSRAKPLISYRVIVNLIAATTTRTGLSVHCELDTNLYPKGIIISDR